MTFLSNCEQATPGCALLFDVPQLSNVPDAGPHRTPVAVRAMLLIVTLSFGLVACKPSSSQTVAAPPKFTPEKVEQSLGLLARESEKGKLRFAALDAVRESAPFVSEFVRLFPGAEVNYRYFTSTDEPGFDVQVDLYERYELAMQLPVHFDSERRKVIGYGEPKFYLVEAASQKGRETSYNPSGERRFGSAEWRTLVKNEGDFSAIGYAMRTTQPVPGFRGRKIQQ